MLDAVQDLPRVELAFCDPRRLGRIRLRASPLTEAPIATLGFDPLLSMPTLDEYTTSILKRKCPVKALLLDQPFNAGVGNWVAGEYFILDLRNYWSARYHH